MVMNNECENEYRINMIGYEYLININDYELINLHIN